MQQQNHRLLQRQLKRHIKDLDAIPPDWQQFLVAVNEAYAQADDDRLRLERMLELSSQELLAANQDLQRVLTSVEQQVCDRTAELTGANTELAQTLNQLQQAQAQLIQVEKMSSLGQLVAGVAHELNNPVTFIDGNLRYVMDYMDALMQVIQQYQVAYPQPTSTLQTLLAEVDFEFIRMDLPKVLTSIKTGAKRIATIVQALRTFSRLDEAEIKQVDIHHCLASTLMLLNGRLELAHQLLIAIQPVYGEIPLVECYAGKLNQVLLDLLSNAIDALAGSAKAGLSQFGHPVGAATPDFEAGGLSARDWTLLAPHRSPVIVITTQVVAGKTLEIQILDNANGIAPAIRDRIFEPFFTTKAVGSGIGMGLATSYQIVTDLHGGSLTYRSTVGYGTAFIIQLPL
jgi:two-component system, NtrC family, sensor kinase